MKVQWCSCVSGGDFVILETVLVMPSNISLVLCYLLPQTNTSKAYIYCKGWRIRNKKEDLTVEKEEDSRKEL